MIQILSIHAKIIPYFILSKIKDINLTTVEINLTAMEINLTIKETNYDVVIVIIMIMN